MADNQKGKETNMHKRIAMGEKVTGMKKGGKACDMKKGGKAGHKETKKKK